MDLPHARHPARVKHPRCNPPWLSVNYSCRMRPASAVYPAGFFHQHTAAAATNITAVNPQHIIHHINNFIYITTSRLQMSASSFEN